jgi:hypothetical protein
MKPVRDLASGVWLDLALAAVIEQGRGGRAPKTFDQAFRALPSAAKEYVHTADD